MSADTGRMTPNDGASGPSEGSTALTRRVPLVTLSARPGDTRFARRACRTYSVPAPATAGVVRCRRRVLPGSEQRSPLGRGGGPKYVVAQAVSTLRVLGVKPHRRRRDPSAPTPRPGYLPARTRQLTS